MIGYIYKITNPQGHVYIGQTKNPKDRFKFYRLLHCKRQTKVYRSIQKYGWDNHSAEIIHMIPYNEVELNNLEKEYIKIYNSFNSLSGLNLTPGGGCGFVSDLSKETIRKKLTGRSLSETTKQKLRNANLGKKQSAETIAKRVAAIKGMKRSEASRQNISNARKGIKFSDSHIFSLKNSVRHPMTPEQREKNKRHLQSIHERGLIKKRVKGKPVIHVIEGKKFESLVLACKFYKLNYWTQRDILNGNYKSKQKRDPIFKRA